MTTDTDRALAALLNADPAVKRARLQHNITRAVIRARDSLPKLSPPHVAAAMEPDQWQDILDAQQLLDAWIEQVRALRTTTPLRLVHNATSHGDAR